MNLYYGQLSCGNVWVARDGSVKVANIGDSLLSNVRSNKEKEREDVQSLGLMMVELMEPDTSLSCPTTLELQHPEAWPDGQGIRAFLALTRTATMQELLEVIPRYSC